MRGLMFLRVRFLGQYAIFEARWQRYGGSLMRLLMPYDGICYKFDMKDRVVFDTNTVFKCYGESNCNGFDILCVFVVMIQIHRKRYEI
jgi:hypothetical protein